MQSVNRKPSGCARFVRTRCSIRTAGIRKAAAVAVATSLLSSAAYAETYTNGGSTNTWSNNANWNPAEPTLTTTAVLPLISTLPGGSTSTITLSTGEQALSLSIGDAYTLTGGDLTLGAGGNIAVDPAIAATINSTLLGTSGLTVNPTAGGTTGTLTLGGANTFTGAVAINAGTLRFSADNNLGATANSLNLGTAGAISYFGAANLSSARTIALGTAAGTDFTSTIRNETSGTTLTFSGVISGGPGNTTVQTTLGSTALNIVGPGSVALTATNTFTGNIVVDTGTLIFTSDAQLGATPAGNFKSIVLQNGGTFLVNTTTTYNPTDGSGTNTQNKRFVIGAGGGTLNVISGGTLQIDDLNQLSGTGNTLTKAGAGLLLLNSKLYTVGTINVNAGTLRAAGVDTLGNASLTDPLNVASGATLDIQAAMTTGRAISVVGSGVNGVGALTNTSGVAASLAVPVLMSGDAAFGANGGAGSLTIPSLDGTSGTRTITKVGTGAVIVSGAGTNFTGTTTVNVTNGTISAGNAAAFGANANITVNPAANAANVSVYNQNGAAGAGYTYTFQNNTMVSGNAAFLGSLNASNTTLAPGASVAEAAAGLNETFATSFGLASDASHLFGISGAVTGENVTVGTGTPWNAISNDGVAGRSFAGTITANSDFSIRALNNSTFGLGVVTLTPASPRTVTVSDGVVQFGGGASNYNGNVTLEVANGATLQTTSGNAFGTTTTAGGAGNNAKVNILNGGVFNPGGTPTNANITIQVGGILNIDDATNLSGIGSITQFPGSVTRITNNGATALNGAMSPGTVPGSIVRLGTDQIASLPSKIDNAAIFEVSGGTRLLPTGNSTTPALVVNSTGTVTIGSFTNVPTGVITNDNASRNLSNPSTTTASYISIGSGGATFVATDGTTLTITGTGSNPSNGSLTVDAGSATINIGLASPMTIDGLAKGGSATVAYGGPADTTTGTPTVGFRAGALNILSGTFVHNGGGAQFQIGGNGVFTSGTGVGLLTVNRGTTFTTATGALIDAQLNVLAGGTARFQPGNDNTVAGQSTSGIQGAGNIILGGSGGTNRDVAVTLGVNNVSSTFSGVISDNSGTNQGSITKVGTGTLILSGNNTYTLGTTINAGVLQLGDGGTAGTVAGNIVNKATLTVNRSNDFTLPGVISGIGALSKTGAGTVTLSASPTYTGSTTIDGGGVSITATTASFPTSALTVNNGGRFSYLPATAGAMSLGSAPLTLADGGQIGLAFGSSINTTGSATTAGTVTLAMSGPFTSDNSYTLLTSGGGLDTASYIVLNPTNYTYAINKTATAVSIVPTATTALATAYWKGGYANNVLSASDGSSTSNFTTDAGGSSPTPLTPGSTTTIQYSASGATGQTSQTLGTNVSVLGVASSDSSAVTINPDGNTLTIGTGGVTLSNGAGPLTIGSHVALGGNQTWTNSSTANALTIGSASTQITAGSNTLTVTGAGAVNIAGNLVGSNTAVLTKTGAGTLTLGGTTNTLKTLNLNSASMIDIGSGNLTINNAGSDTIQSNITSGTAFINATGGGAIVLTVNNTNGPDNGVADGGTLQINARVTGTSTFEFYRSGVTTGVIYLANNNNDFTGGIVLNRGVIRVDTIGNTGSPSGLGTGGTILMGSGTNVGTLRYTGTGETTNKTVALNTTTANPTLDMSGTGTLTFSSNFTAPGAGSKTLNLTGSTSGVGVIAGVIPNNAAANTTSLAKAGTGTWILEAANTYTGNTTVTAGRLLVNGSITSNASVTGGTIGGSGSIAGSLTVNSGGTLAPGNSPGVLTVSGPVTLNSGSTYAVEIGGTTPGNGSGNYDQTNVTGTTNTLTLGGNLSITSFNNFTNSNPNQLYFIMTQAGAAPVSGNFNGLPEGSPIVFADGTAQITYTANWTGSQLTSTGSGTGNDVALYNVNLVPEPATAGLLGLAAVGLLARRRRVRASR